MNVQKIWMTLLPVLLITMLVLSGCSGSGTTPQSSTAKTVTINGSLEQGVAKMVQKGVNATVTSATVTAIDAATGKTISTAPANIMPDNTFSLTINVPSSQTVVALTTNGLTTNYHAIIPIDLSSPPLNQVNNMVALAMGPNSDTIAKAVSVSLGANGTLGDVGVLTAAAFGNAKNTVIQYGGTALAYGSATSSNASLSPVTVTFLTTATPYQPQQDLDSYEQAPTGFKPVFTEAVIRHGSRGLSSYDGTVYSMWLKAAADGALTTLGAQLGPDVMRIMKANALLGQGVAGITTPGYGNLSKVGISEQQSIAARLLQRLSAYFPQVAASRNTSVPRQIVYASSGVNRAADSAGFFTQSLMTNYTSLRPLITKSAALTAYPVGKPVAQAAGVNRFLLYFHKLAAKTDLVTDTTDLYYQTYQDSLTYQAYLKNANMLAKVNAVLTNTDAKNTARTVLERLFTKEFVDKIDNGTYTFANSGSYVFKNDDGSYVTTLTGDGSTTVRSLADAASALYSLYVIVPAMKVELNSLDFTPYIPAAQASVLAYQDDVQSFYQKGPGITEDSSATFKMAQILKDDFFNEVDAIAKGNLAHGAVLRFTHGEQIMPFASILGLKNMSVPVDNANTYTYAINTWRGSVVSPLAANVQWDVYSDSKGTLLVKMLYNEKEADFKADCDLARYAPGSRYYTYSGLKTCYNHIAN